MTTSTTTKVAISEIWYATRERCDEGVIEVDMVSYLGNSYEAISQPAGR